MKVFLIGIYTIDAILILWILFSNYKKKMEKINKEERELIYSEENNKNINNNNN